jgi:Flp pilus assembly protein TadD
VVARGAADPDPLVRLGAVSAAEGLEPRARLAPLRPLLRDPLGALRIEAARVLAPVPPALWPAGARVALADALAEYRAAQRVSADRPEAHVNLGVLHTQLGELDQARREYETAIRLAPYFLPARLNLADLYRLEGREDEGERVLLEALEGAPQSAELHHALGLLRVRQQRLPEALDALARAAALAPEQPRLAYVYAVALHSTGGRERALSVLADAQQRHPGDREILLALATFSRDAGAFDQARSWAARLLALDPEDPNARALARELEAAGR